jgi:DNA polymerase alpha subunit A
MGILICVYNQEEDVKIYDEVTEDQYKSIVKGRLQRDDFVVDDGVEGYMDNGMDDWADGDGSESEEEVNARHKRMRRSSASGLLLISVLSQESS